MLDRMHLRLQPLVYHYFDGAHCTLHLTVTTVQVAQ